MNNSLDLAVRASQNQPTLGQAKGMPAVVDRKSVITIVFVKKPLPNRAQLNTQLAKNRSSVKRHTDQAMYRQMRHHDAKVNID